MVCLVAEIDTVIFFLILEVVDTENFETVTSNVEIDVGHILHLKKTVWDDNADLFVAVQVIPGDQEDDHSFSASCTKLQSTSRLVLSKKLSRKQNLVVIHLESRLLHACEAFRDLLD